ncbi:hypothetical protein BST96_14975 [Oceanicoccus sagamiensis]|uniref:Uncharacterized protein n=2 Tax=Oceanicoccus sagamiensis TaxID=716816 RepID=A0A1X9NFW1_9GAMM|nr:hypothetical protein BST96_14975 [Oceanicoccus sagamiensis]
MLNPGIPNTIKPAFLRSMASKKYIQGYTTIELMTQAKTEGECLMIAAVSLFDVKHGAFYSAMSEQEAGFVKGCHSVVRQFLEEANIPSDTLSV